MSPWGKRKAASLRCVPDRVLFRGHAAGRSYRQQPKQEEQKMEREFCKGWTQNQLSAAFSQAHMDAQSAKAAAREAAYWRDMAYIAMLTGGEPPPYQGYHR
jgi:hypothetical protein